MAIAARRCPAPLPHCYSILPLLLLHQASCMVTSPLPCIPCALHQVAVHPLPCASSALNRGCGRSVLHYANPWASACCWPEDVRCGVAACRQRACALRIDPLAQETHYCVYSLDRPGDRRHHLTLRFPACVSQAAAAAAAAQPGFWAGFGGGSCFLVCRGPRLHADACVRTGSTSACVCQGPRLPACFKLHVCLHATGSLVVGANYTEVGLTSNACPYLRACSCECTSTCLHSYSSTVYNIITNLIELRAVEHIASTGQQMVSKCREDFNLHT